MRATVTAFILGLMAGGAAAAADLGDPVWDRAPGRDDWAKVYPTHAAEAGISGAVKLKCAASATGSLQDCAVVQESPGGEGFGAAALALSAGMALKPTAQNGQPIAGRSLIVPVKFEPGLLHPGAIIGNPDWLKRPTNDELLNYWPSQARGAAGKAAIACVVSNRGLLEKCQIERDDPPGHGFGGAALAMSAMFLMRPMTLDGLPVGGGRVMIPINFEGSLGREAPFTSVRVARVAPWGAVPTAYQVASAFPKGAIGKLPSGHVVLRCSMQRTGALQDCDTIQEEPEGHGFAQAAHGLTRDFKVILDPKVDKLTDIRVDVPFDFRDPSQPGPPLEIYDPIWLQRISPDGVVKLFPEAAAKAGLRQGRATVDCSVAHDGSLKECAVSSEDPGGLGFGDSALQVAAVMKMNPWTAQGAPVDGARVRLPIKFVLPDHAPAAPAQPPAKP
jgi:TonB family protein